MNQDIDPQDEIVFVAFRDSGEENGMAPVTRDGRLALFPSRDEARAAAGALGVGAAQTWARAMQLCKRYGINPPTVSQGS
jgi:hypothetical protein